MSEICTSLVRPQLQTPTLMERAPLLAGKGSLTAQQLDGHLSPRQLLLLQEADSCTDVTGSDLQGCKPQPVSGPESSGGTEDVTSRLQALHCMQAIEMQSEEPI